MRALILLVGFVMCLSAASCLATSDAPTSPVIMIRSQFCANAPRTEAGTTLPRRNHSIRPRHSTSTVLWCAPGRLVSRPLGPWLLTGREIIKKIRKDRCTWLMDAKIWRAHNSETYIILRMIRLIPGPAVVRLLREASVFVSSHLAIIGDGLLAGGRFAWLNDALAVEVANANNHQTTWGVLRAALVALDDYMEVNEQVGAAEFTIFDGGTEVGTGLIGMR